MYMSFCNFISYSFFRLSFNVLCANQEWPAHGFQSACGILLVSLRILAERGIHGEINYAEWRARKAVSEGTAEPRMFAKNCFAFAKTVWFWYTHFCLFGLERRVMTHRSVAFLSIRY